MHLIGFRSVRLLTGFFALAAAALVVPFGQADAADPKVEAIVVKYRADSFLAQPADMPVEMQQRLADRLQSGFAASGVTRDGGYRIILNPPLTYGEAREALTRIRMDGAVLYASVLATSAPASSVNAGPKTASDLPLPTNRIVVKYRDSNITSAMLAGQRLAQTDVERITALAGEPVAFVRAMHDGGAVMSLFRRLPLAEVRTITSRIAQEPNVEFAQPDYIMMPQLVPTDPCYASASIGACNANFQWDLFEAVGGVNMPLAWDLTTGSAIQRVAVLDTGYLLHPDLAGRITNGWDFITDAVIANDNVPVLPCYPGGPNPCENSRDADAFDVGDWISAADANGSTFGGYLFGCFVDDSSWHGTHVSGTIGANPSNGMGVAGINWVSSIIPMRVLGKCGGFNTDIADAMVWASGGSVPGLPANPTPARVLNLSLGGSLGAGNTCADDDPVTQNAINAAVANGAVVVVSAGNGNINAATQSPASCNNATTVASTTRNGGRAYYSNFGPYVEIAAPGGGRTANDVTARPLILSTLNSGLTSPNLTPAGFIYQNYQGTSMAAPHVSGIASLMLSIAPELTPTQVVSLIQSSARAFPTGTGGDCTSGTPSGPTLFCGAGIIDARAAIAAALAKGGIARAGARRDFNGNNRSDITWFNVASGEKQLWLMKGGLTAGSSTLLTSLGWQVTHYGDFNKDGATDLLWRNASTGDTVMWMQNGTTLIGFGTLLTSTAWSVVRVGDFNGDARTDLLWRNSVTGDVVVWLMDGTTIIGSGVLLTDLNWIPTLTGDFNGDGKDDILWRHASTGVTVVWLMNGAMIAGSGVLMPDANWTATHLADVNGDGKADIFWRHSSGATALWLMNGTLIISGVGLLPDPNWVVVGTDDLNGDGKADILWLNTGTGATAAWLMNGTALISGSPLLPAPWLITRTGDFNGDGMADILWTNPATGSKVMWLMNGLVVLGGFALSGDPNMQLYP